jgi:hypothetical protein
VQGQGVVILVFLVVFDLLDFDWVLGLFLFPDGGDEVL